MTDAPVGDAVDGSPRRPAGQDTRPGSEVLRLVSVMHILRGPGGCPWDRDQTHQSLAQYCLEEAYEVVDAIECGTRADLVEELGDLLLQVIFHAEIAAQDAQPFDIDDVARGITTKLIRRHPFVFSGGQADPQIAAIAGTPTTAADQHATWDRIKTVEKRRTSVLDGIPRAMGAAARAQKIVGRAQRAGMDMSALLPGVQPAHPESHVADAGPPADAAASGTAGPREGDRAYGDQLLTLIAHIQGAGLDAETELRAATAALEARIRAQEASLQPEEQ